MVHSSPTPPPLLCWCRSPRCSRRPRRKANCHRSHGHVTKIPCRFVRIDWIRAFFELSSRERGTIVNFVVAIGAPDYFTFSADADHLGSLERPRGRTAFASKRTRHGRAICSSERVHPSRFGEQNTTGNERTTNVWFGLWLFSKEKLAEKQLRSGDRRPNAFEVIGHYALSPAQLDRVRRTQL